MAEIKLTENASSPAAPPAGQISLYAKTDGNLYSKNPANAETLVTVGAAITTLTGDVAAVGPGSAVATIQTNVVSNTKLAQMPANTVKGNNTGVSANAQDLTVIPVTLGGTNSTTALNNNRVMQSSGGAIVEAAAITASKALVSDANGIPVASSTTSAELGYVAGVTSAIQSQLNSKQPTLSTGNITTSTAGMTITGGTGAVIGSGVTINYTETPPKNRIVLYDDFLGTAGLTTVGDRLNWASWTGGGNATVLGGATEQGHPGVAVPQTGTMAGAGRGGFGLANSSNNVVNGLRISTDTWVEEWLISLAQLSNVTDEFYVALGLHASSTLKLQVDTASFKYDRASYGTNWQCETASASSTTRTDSGVAATTGWVKFRLEVNTTDCKFYINDTLVATNSTNLPSGVTIAPGIRIEKSAGTTNTKLYVDYYYAYMNFATPR